jgi:TonB family protein
MTTRRIYLFLSPLLVMGAAIQASAQANPPANDGLTMKMRVYEVLGKGGGMPIKAVTSSYLNMKLTVTTESDYDLAEEMKQIKKTFNYADVKLLTEADFTWMRTKRDRALHVFRLDSQEYNVLIMPQDIVRDSSFLIEVYEQGEKAKANLLSTSFTIPEKNIAVFGFEDSKGDSYFLSFRVTGWKPAAYLLEKGASEPSYVIPAEGPVRAVGEIKPPRLIKLVDPKYPDEARLARVDGVVILEVETDVYGRVKNMMILRSIPLLDLAALDAVRKWAYEPFKLNGKPRGVIFTATVRFLLVDALNIAAPRKDSAPLKIMDNL